MQRWGRRTLTAVVTGILLFAAGACGDDVADVSKIDLPGAPSGFALTPPGKKLAFGAATTPTALRSASASMTYSGLSSARLMLMIGSGVRD